MSKRRVTQEQIDGILKDDAEYIIQHRVFDKLTLVICKLPNGYVLVGSSGCIDPENYDAELGESICRKQIEDQLWKLEGYYLTERNI